MTILCYGWHRPKATNLERGKKYLWWSNRCCETFLNWCIRCLGFHKMYHEPGGLNNRHLLFNSLSDRSPRPRCHRHWLLLSTEEENVFQASALLLVFTGNLPLFLAFAASLWCLPSSLHVAFSVWVCVCIPISPFYKGTSHIRLGAPPQSYMNLS